VQLVLNAVGTAEILQRVPRYQQNEHSRAVVAEEDA
jgi:hypothetical protein